MITNLWPIIPLLKTIEDKVSKIHALACPCITPVITIGSTSVEVCADTEVAIGTNSPECMTYQWQESVADVWTDIPGETDKTLTVTPTLGTHTYRLVGTNTRCSGISNEYTITVIEC